MENPGPARGREQQRQRRRRLQQRSPTPPLLPTWVYDITVDEYGVFHPRPNCPGGPFRSRVEATVAIRCKHCRGPPGVVLVRLYGETMLFEGFPTPARPGLYITIQNGMFHVHPNDLGGPFESLSDAMTAIQLDSALSRMPPLPKGFYFTLKDGLFHIHPDGLGGPFGRLHDATDAIRKHEDSLKPPPFDYFEEGREKIRRMRKFLSELNPDDYRPVTFSPQIESSKSPTKDTNSSVHDVKRKISDPVVLEAIAMFNRMDMEEEAKRNGMRWMQSEVIKAFEMYLSSNGTENVKYEFQKLEHQCLIYPKGYHHYNFTMKIKMPSEKRWDYKSFFAEVKPMNKGKHYFCRPLQNNDNGHCFGCSNVGIKLRHPASGGYEEGNVDSGFPFSTGDSD